MRITKSANIAGSPGSAAYFTGDVTIAPLHKAAGPERADALRVSFAAGARTAWHTHPLGQLLIVVEGEGWVQTAGEPKQVVHPGDVVWFPAGERHWHGATAQSAMVHIAMQEALDGRTADWAEPVSDADYLG